MPEKPTIEQSIEKVKEIGESPIQRDLESKVDTVKRAHEALDQAVKELEEIYEANEEAVIDEANEQNLIFDNLKANQERIPLIQQGTSLIQQLDEAKDRGDWQKVVGCAQKLAELQLQDKGIDLTIERYTEEQAKAALDKINKAIDTIRGIEPVSAVTQSRGDVESKPEVKETVKDSEIFETVKNSLRDTEQAVLEYIMKPNRIGQRCTYKEIIQATQEEKGYNIQEKSMSTITSVIRRVLSVFFGKQGEKLIVTGNGGITFKVGESAVFTIIPTSERVKKALTEFQQADEMTLDKAIMEVLIESLIKDHNQWISTSGFLKRIEDKTGKLINPNNLGEPIKRLRQKMGDSLKESHIIQSMIKVGYRLSKDVMPVLEEISKKKL